MWELLIKVSKAFKISGLNLFRSQEGNVHICIKVENILKGSLDLIPSPSVKIQIMGGKVCLRCKGKTLLYVKF